MSKDILVAGAIAAACLVLVAVAVLAPRKTPEPEVTAHPQADSGQDLGFGPVPTDPGFPLGVPATGMGMADGSGFNAPGGFPTPVGGFGFDATGTSLNPMPALPAQTVEPVAAAPAATIHTVASGELLGDIALKHYKSSKAWRKIVEANPGLDPHHIKVGQKLTIPALEPAVAGAPPTSGNRSYTVKKGDSLYAIARKELNDGNRWKEIERLNKVSNAELRIGQVLVLPESANSTTSTPSGDAPTASGKTHTVTKGESLAGISTKYFGTTAKWREIAKANPGVTPDNLKIGQKLVIPDHGGASVPSTVSSAGPASEYVVKAGDTLSAIAASQMGDKGAWKKIVDANPGLNPKNMRIGQKLIIPGKSVTAPASVAPPAPVFAPSSPDPGPAFNPNPVPSFAPAPTGQNSFAPAPSGNNAAPVTGVVAPSDFSSPYQALPADNEPAGFGEPQR